MDNMSDSAVLAVDGGGTRCRVAVERRGRRHQAVLGAANVASDFDGAVRTLSEGLDRLAAEAGLAPQALRSVPAYLGLAGVMGPEDGLRVAKALSLTMARVEDDRRAAVRGALGAEDGALAGLGTGSFFARQSGGAIRLAGGWGSRLGDMASAFWLVREALSATLDAVDGLTAGSSLTRAMLDRFEGGAPGIVAFSLSATPGEMAALAPLVADANDAGDPVARGIVTAGAEYVLRTLGALGWRAGEALVLIGGASTIYTAHFPEPVREAVIAPRASALDGALDLARDLAMGAA